ncbi:MAG: hypothetical protein GXP26_09465 [Planctomycetes bacterium]|nr:hypothetical protein [Planctomycetota bacterium]
MPATTPESTSQNPTNASGPSVSVLAVGDWNKREFSSAIAEIADTESWQVVANAESASQYLMSLSQDQAESVQQSVPPHQAGAACGTPPELIVLAQSIPGEFRQSDIDRLSELAPLARIIVVAGTWCEGEMRTGSRLDGTLRLYWYEFAPWWQAALRNLAGGLCPPWSLPLDNPQAGRGISNTHSASKPLTGTVVVDAADFAVFESLSSALASFGINAAWTCHDDPASLPSHIAAGIWDGGQLNRKELARLTSFCQKIQAHGKVVALLDFPRVEHVEQTRAAGAAAVFGKPYLVDEVVAALH